MQVVETQTRTQTSCIIHLRNHSQQLANLVSPLAPKAVKSSHLIDNEHGL